MVSDHPSEFEIRYNRPLVGPGTKLFSDALGKAKFDRGQIHITMTVCCRPPEDDMGKFLAVIRSKNKKIVKINKERVKNGEEPYALIKNPQECCAPRLERELEQFDQIITLGSWATKAVLHKSASVMSLRGGPTEIERDGKKIRILPTLHPSLVTKSPKWTIPFISDIRKAFRWFESGLDWKVPTIYYNPSPSELEEFLNRRVGYWTYDVETNGIESLTAKIRCIAIGTAKEVAVVGLLGIDGRSRFYSREDEAAVLDVMKRFMVDETKLKCGHNAGYYDKLVIENQWGVTPTPLIDTMLVHRLVESELPHSLGFVGSMYTNAPSWKTDRDGRKKAYGSETDDELHEYCGYDVAVTAEILPPLLEQLAIRQQDECLQCDHKLQQICAEMHSVGMFVHQPTRHKLEKKLMREVHQRRAKIRDMCGVDNLNPGSPQQLRKLFFEDWALLPYLTDRLKPKEYLTMSGEPSTGDNVMRALLTVSTLTDQQRTTLENIRLYRRSQKLLGTYVTKLRYSDEEAWTGWDDDDTWVDADLRAKYGLKKMGIVDKRTNRMHPGYNAHVTTTGRLSSSSPINAQNFPKDLRSMVVAAPGHVLVGADMDQLELRIAASRWKSRKYLRAFEQGLDPHSSVTAWAVFGKVFEKAAKECGAGPYPWVTGTKFTGDAAKLRGLSKGVQYASQYAATVETVHRVIQQTETDNGDGTTELPYLLLSVREVRMMHKKWCAEAKFDQGWEREIETYRQLGYLEEPIMKRRRDFLDGENVNEIVNYPIQASGASIMNLALLSLREHISPHQWGYGTGIINQCHDSIVVECPVSEAQKVARLLEECMNQRISELPSVDFTATAEISHSWRDVG